MQGWTPLHHIAGVGSMSHSYYKSLCKQLIEEFLQAGADIDAIDNKVIVFLLVSHASMCSLSSSWTIRTDVCLQQLFAPVQS